MVTALLESFDCFSGTVQKVQQCYECYLIAENVIVSLEILFVDTTLLTLHSFDSC